MAKDKRSFFERLTGTVRIDDNDSELDFEEHQKQTVISPKRSMPMQQVQQMQEKAPQRPDEWMEETVEEGQLTVDVYQNANDIVIKTIVAGVKPEDLDISISRDMVTIRGKREEVREVSDDDYFHQELYWGSFSRTVLLPEEIDVESSEATERHGLLTLRLPKIDKRRQTKLRVKTN
jgi:HSP20 family protein